MENKRKKKRGGGWRRGWNKEGRGEVGKNRKKKKKKKKRREEAHLTTDQVRNRRTHSYVFLHHAGKLGRAEHRVNEDRRSKQQTFATVHIPFARAFVTSCQLESALKPSLKHVSLKEGAHS